MTQAELKETNESSRPQDVSQRETERAILALLLSEPHAWTGAEIVRELDGQAIAAHDAIAGLVRSGLANREGALLFAARAARAFEDLEP